LICGILGFSVSKCWTEEFANGNFFYNFILFNIATTGQRFMYYTPWCFLDSINAACGLAFNGIKKNGKTDNSIEYKPGSQIDWSRN